MSPSTPSAAIQQRQTNQQHQNLLFVRHTERERGWVGREERSVVRMRFMWAHLLCLSEFPVLGELNKISTELWWGKKTNTKSICLIYFFFFLVSGLSFLYYLTGLVVIYLLYLKVLEPPNINLSMKQLADLLSSSGSCKQHLVFKVFWAKPLGK